jgi:hypothetical protein
MARKIIDIGTIGNDGTGDSIRDSFRKVNDNFRELYSSLGLGDKLTFIGLDDTPSTYVGQNDPATGNTPIVTINNTESGLTFKQLRSGNGISIDFDTNPNEITINAKFAAISADANPQLGGDLSARSGGNQYRILDLPPLDLTDLNNADKNPKNANEAISKAYADTKVSLAGVNSIDPETGRVNASMGRMGGPLILSRDPEPDDDELYGGLIAATKRYVDNAAFGSIANLYVAMSGQDDRPGVSKALQGRALAYAYRTLEAALKRAEELVLEAREEIGPYKKVLTYNNGASQCYLASTPYASPISGSGFVGVVNMSVDTVTINDIGINYYPGDILELSGGTVSTGGGKCTIEVLTTLTTPGAISTYRIISTGSYRALPGATNVATTILTSAAPAGVGAIGQNASFNVTYKVNSVSITNGGSGYSLVSVRITPAVGDTTGSGAFGTAVVSGGAVSSITITDKGTGFTALPTLEVNLPRFAIYTAGYRTDFTGDVTTNTPESIRGRDIREGLYLRGEETGALAQILGHSGELDSFGNELFDVDIKYGAFKVGETISYGDVSKNIQISILVESGEYYENYPLKLPQNCSIVGDEFRRVIFRPKPGTSSSPWSFQKFRRDLVIDGLTVTEATKEFGYHYLQNADEPVYPKIDNKGAFTSAASLLELNRSFMQEEIIAWMNYNITNGISPFAGFEYKQNLCKRDVGLIIDSLVFDLKWGGYNRTISAGLKYYESDSARVAITTQLTQYRAVLAKLKSLMISSISNTVVTPVRQTLYSQIIDPAYQAEVGSNTVINDLMAALEDVMDGSGSVNYPKENQEMDVFLANDAVRWQAISAIGHGGFMGVLDPEGQILSRSPYFQECASFSRSKDRQVFAGGMFVDGFAGNLQFTITAVNNPGASTRLSVTGLDRFPELPCSFIVFDTVYRVNYIRDFVYNKNGSSATFILDETTPWPYDVFTYNSAICSRDVGYIVDGLGYDLVLGTNYNTRISGLTYRLSNASVVLEDQRQITINAINYAHELVNNSIPTYTTIQTTVDLSAATITDIIDRGVAAAPTLTYTLPPGVSTDITSAYNLLLSNRNYIVAETQGWIKAQIAGNISPWATGDTYNEAKSERDTLYVIEAVIYDLIYGGNSATRRAALKYWNGMSTSVSMLASGQPARCAAAIDYANYLAKQVVQNLAPATAYSTLSRTTGTAATGVEAGIIDTLMDSISAVITGGVGAAPTEVLPNLSAYAYNATSKAARADIIAAKASIQTGVINYVDETGNQFELLMPGNRSMLANDYTQINDMGYGAIAMNGGLLELVSVFTYYCWISYYSVTGGQIRSVGGSSSHGVYALVAEGADPLEVPTPTTLYEDLSQRVVCYYPSPAYANTKDGLFIYVYKYDYTPLGSSELEIDHDGIIYRYPVVSVTTTDLPLGVARLNLSTGASSAELDGLFDQVPADTKMTLRANGQVILTGGLEDVAVRPSTGLKLREDPNFVYRVLQFTSYNDVQGPYSIAITSGSPAIFKILETITDIDTDVCTTSKPHKLLLGDKFIPTSTANGLVEGTTYYVIDVPQYNQFKLSTAPGGASATLTNGTGLSIQGARTHRLLENYTLSFSSSGSLPNPMLAGETYYVSSTNLTETEFTISLQRYGTALNTTTSGSGSFTLSLVGLTRTNLRENYNYVELTLWQPGEFVTSGSPCTISIGSPAVITLPGHTFSAGDVVKFETTGNLPTGISKLVNYHVLSTGLVAGTSFRVSLEPEGTAADTSGSQSGVQTVGLVTGRAGDTTFAVTPIGPGDIGRVGGSKFVFKGEEYIISTYAPETVTNEAFARVTLDRPLEDSLISYASAYTIKSGVAKRTSGSLGTLTIRIALTRVTSHDLLEIGTGSYADTNYPKEIYGQSVNALNEDTETDERDVGRCFYVTTDQYGNFKVGPYFKVDQGTGTVTFSSSIALSNLDGIGFKRGVPVSEFSTDSGFTDNATDTVPTENATRIYIERRLGLTHAGAKVPVEQLIPTVTGGYMPLDGQLAMKADMDLDSHKILRIADATDPQDAINLRSLTWDNFQDFTPNNTDAADILVFTGSNNDSVNATVIGDVTFELRQGIDSTVNQVDVQIVPDTIINVDVKSDADIAQSKLLMTFATAETAAPTGTRRDKQARSGLSSFDTVQFTVTDGFVTIKDNGLTLSKINQIPGETLLGNSNITTGNVTAVPFSTIVNAGAAIKKSQYSSTGFLRRITSGSFTSDADYTIVEAGAGSAANPEASKLVIRDANGDFGARTVDLSQLKIDNNTAIDSDTTATGGYIRYYGHSGAGGIIVQSGSLATDKVTYYDNDLHQFRNQSGLSLGSIRAAEIQATTLTSGGTTANGTIRGYWQLDTGSRLQATYSADLAEYYEGDKEYEVGTVLVFGGDKEVTTSNVRGDTRVAGVVSDNAAYTMYGACPGLKNLVALQGRVPCKVVGKIKKGDILITAGIHGVAVAANGDAKVGTVVGKALESYESDHIGTIEIAVGRT